MTMTMVATATAMASAPSAERSGLARTASGALDDGLSHGQSAPRRRRGRRAPSWRSRSAWIGPDTIVVAFRHAVDLDRQAADDAGRDRREARRRRRRREDAGRPSRSTTACSGTASALRRSAATISASHVRPGRNGCVGAIEAHLDAKLARRGLRAELRQRARADLDDAAGKALAGQRLQRDRRRHAGDSRITSASATLTSALIALRSEIVIRIVPGWFCTPMTTISPTSTSSRVTTPSIGAVISVFVQLIAGPGALGAALATRRSRGRGRLLRSFDRGVRRRDLRLRRGLGGDDAIEIGGRQSGPRGVTAGPRQRRWPLPRRATGPPPARPVPRAPGVAAARASASSAPSAPRPPRPSTAAWTGSMRATTWPAVTPSPSFTVSDTSRPITFAPISA